MSMYSELTIRNDLIEHMWASIEATESAEQIASNAASDRAHERLKKVVACKQAAEAALSLAKAAKTPETMRAEAEKAISMYEEYKKYYIYRQPDIDAQVNRAEKLAALAQRELEKNPIQRWIEQYWDLFI